MADAEHARVDLQLTARDASTRNIAAQLNKSYFWVVNCVSTSRHLTALADHVLGNLGLDGNHQVILFPDVAVHAHLKSTSISWGPSIDPTAQLLDVYKILGCPSTVHLLYHIITPPASCTDGTAEQPVRSAHERQHEQQVLQPAHPPVVQQMHQQHVHQKQSQCALSAMQHGSGQATALHQQPSLQQRYASTQLQDYHAPAATALAAVAHAALQSDTAVLPGSGRVDDSLLPWLLQQTHAMHEAAASAHMPQQSFHSHCPNRLQPLTGTHQLAQAEYDCMQPAVSTHNLIMQQPTLPVMSQQLLLAQQQQLLQQMAHLHQVAASAGVAWPAKHQSQLADRSDGAIAARSLSVGGLCPQRANTAYDGLHHHMVPVVTQESSTAAVAVPSGMVGSQVAFGHDSRAGSLQQPRHLQELGCHDAAQLLQTHQPGTCSQQELLQGSAGAAPGPRSSPCKQQMASAAGANGGTGHNPCGGSPANVVEPAQPQAVAPGCHTLLQACSLTSSAVEARPPTRLQRASCEGLSWTHSSVQQQQQQPLHHDFVPHHSDKSTLKAQQACVNALDGSGCPDSEGLEVAAEQQEVAAPLAGSLAADSPSGGCRTLMCAKEAAHADATHAQHVASQGLVQHQQPCLPGHVVLSKLHDNAVGGRHPLLCDTAPTSEPSGICEPVQEQHYTAGACHLQPQPLVQQRMQHGTVAAMPLNAASDASIDGVPAGAAPGDVAVADTMGASSAGVAGQLATPVSTVCIRRSDGRVVEVPAILEHGRLVVQLPDPGLWRHQPEPAPPPAQALQNDLQQQPSPAAPDAQPLQHHSQPQQQQPWQHQQPAQQHQQTLQVCPAAVSPQIRAGARCHVQHMTLSGCEQPAAQQQQGQPPPLLQQQHHQAPDHVPAVQLPTAASVQHPQQQPSLLRSMMQEAGINALQSMETRSFVTQQGASHQQQQQQQQLVLTVKHHHHHQKQHDQLPCDLAEPSGGLSHVMADQVHQDGEQQPKVSSSLAAAVAATGPRLQHDELAASGIPCSQSLPTAAVHSAPQATCPPVQAVTAVLDDIGGATAGGAGCEADSAAGCGADTPSGCVRSHCSSVSCGAGAAGSGPSSRYNRAVSQAPAQVVDAAGVGGSATRSGVHGHTSELLTGGGVSGGAPGDDRQLGAPDSTQQRVQRSSSSRLSRDSLRGRGVLQPRQLHMHDEPSTSSGQRRQQLLAASKQPSASQQQQQQQQQLLPEEDRSKGNWQPHLQCIPEHHTPAVAQRYHTSAAGDSQLHVQLSQPGDSALEEPAGSQSAQGGAEQCLGMQPAGLQLELSDGGITPAATIADKHMPAQQYTCSAAAAGAQTAAGYAASCQPAAEAPQTATSHGAVCAEAAGAVGVVAPVAAAACAKEQPPVQDTLKPGHCLSTGVNAACAGAHDVSHQEQVTGGGDGADCAYADAAASGGGGECSGDGAVSCDFSDTNSPAASPLPPDPCSHVSLGKQHTEGWTVLKSVQQCSDVATQHCKHEHCSDQHCPSGAGGGRQQLTPCKRSCSAAQGLERGCTTSPGCSTLAPDVSQQRPPESGCVDDVAEGDNVCAAKQHAKRSKSEAQPQACSALAGEDVAVPSIVCQGKSAAGTWHVSTGAWDSRTFETPMALGDYTAGSVFSVAQLLHQQELQERLRGQQQRKVAPGSSSSSRSGQRGVPRPGGPVPTGSLLSTGFKKGPLRPGYRAPQLSQLQVMQQQQQGVPGWAWPYPGAPGASLGLSGGGQAALQQLDIAEAQVAAAAAAMAGGQFMQQPLPPGVMLPSSARHLMSSQGPVAVCGQLGADTQQQWPQPCVWGGLGFEAAVDCNRGIGGLGTTAAGLLHPARTTAMDGVMQGTNTAAGGAQALSDTFNCADLEALLQSNSIIALEQQSLHHQQQQQHVHPGQVASCAPGVDMHQALQAVGTLPAAPHHSRPAAGTSRMLSSQQPDSSTCRESITGAALSTSSKLHQTCPNNPAAAVDTVRGASAAAGLQRYPLPNGQVVYVAAHPASLAAAPVPALIPSGSTCTASDRGPQRPGGLSRGGGSAMATSAAAAGAGHTAAALSGSDAAPDRPPPRLAAAGDDLKLQGATTDTLLQAQQQEVPLGAAAAAPAPGGLSSGVQTPAVLSPTAAMTAAALRGLSTADCMEAILNDKDFVLGSVFKSPDKGIWINGSSAAPTPSAAAGLLHSPMPPPPKRHRQNEPAGGDQVPSQQQHSIDFQALYHSFREPTPTAAAATAHAAAAATASTAAGTAATLQGPTGPSVGAALDTHADDTQDVGDLCALLLDPTRGDSWLVPPSSCAATASTHPHGAAHHAAGAVQGSCLVNPRTAPPVAAAAAVDDAAAASGVAKAGAAARRKRQSKPGQSAGQVHKAAGTATRQRKAPGAAAAAADDEQQRQPATTRKQQNPLPQGTALDPERPFAALFPKQ